MIQIRGAARRERAGGARIFAKGESDMEARELEDLKKAAEAFGDLEKSVDRLGASVNDSSRIIKNQAAMLDIALDLMISLTVDDDVEARVRRRLLFALQQIKGIGVPT